MFLAILQLISLVSVGATPISTTPQSREVFVPHILTPDEDTVWHAGQMVNVTWDTSDAPSPTHIINEALIVLHIRPFSDAFEPVTMAANFSLTTGFQEVQVPWSASTNNSYAIVLFGDSGNWSPTFTIINDLEAAIAAWKVLDHEVNPTAAFGGA